MTSDYPIDKVIYTHEEPVAISSLNFNDVSIAHGLGFTPLVQAQWTQDSAWGYAYDENSGPVNAGFQRIVQTAVESNSTSIKLYNTNNQAFSTTVYWRLYAFMPTTVNVDASFTANLADPFAVNSDYNYPKLFDAGVTSYSSTPGSQEILTHGLGYRPQVLVWAEDSTRTYFINSSALVGSSINNNYCKVGTSTITLVRDNGFISSPIRFHYRIYLEPQ